MNEERNAGLKIRWISNPSTIQIGGTKVNKYSNADANVEL
jgi:hypothetical protein